MEKLKLKKINVLIILRKCKTAIELIVDFILKVVNTIYFLLTPNLHKLVVNGYFSNKLGYTKKNNLGDDLNFYLLKLISGKKIFSYSDLLIKCKNLLFIGSILQKYMNEESIIWGSGTIDDKESVLIKPLAVRAVRGPLTRQWLLNNKINCPEIYSDPALLLPLVYQSKVLKKYKYGIIPHYVDWDSPGVLRLCDLLADSSITVISMADYKTCEDVIDKINECEFIISSSLHGIIISDAYKIPNLWVEFSDKVAGEGFKFKDYFLSVNRKNDHPLVVDINTSLTDIDVYKDAYEIPSINLIPFLKASPIDILPKLLEKAINYYCVQSNVLKNEN